VCVGKGGGAADTAFTYLWPFWHRGSLKARVTAVSDAAKIP